MARKITRLLKDITVFTDGSGAKYLRSVKFNGAVINNPTPYPPIPSGSYEYSNVNGTLEHLSMNYSVISVKDSDCLGDVSLYPKVHNHNDYTMIGENIQYATYPKEKVAHIYNPNEYYIDSTTGFTSCEVVTDYSTMTTTSEITTDKDVIIRDIEYNYLSNTGAVEVATFADTWSDFISTNLVGYNHAGSPKRTLYKYYYKTIINNGDLQTPTCQIIIKRVHVYTRAIEDIHDVTINADNSSCGNGSFDLLGFNSGVASVGTNEVHSDSEVCWTYPTHHTAIELPYGYMDFRFTYTSSYNNGIDTGYRRYYYDLNINNGTVSYALDICNDSLGDCGGVTIETFLTSYHSLYFPRGALYTSTSLVGSCWHSVQKMEIYNYTTSIFKYYPIPNAVIPTANIESSYYNPSYNNTVFFQNNNYVYFMYKHGRVGGSCSTHPTKPEEWQTNQLLYRWYGDVVRFNRSTYEFENVYIPFYSFYFNAISGTKYYLPFHHDDTYTYHILGNKTIRLNLDIALNRDNFTTSLNDTVIHKSYYPDNITDIIRECHLYTSPSTPQHDVDYDVNVDKITFTYDHYIISNTDSSWVIIDSASNNTQYTDNNVVGTYYYSIAFYDAGGTEILIDDITVSRITVNVT